MTTYDQDYGRPITVEEAKKVLALAGYDRGAGLVSASIEAMRAYPPGRPWRDLAKDLGIPEHELLLLAANENVLGPSPKAVDAAARALKESHLYPDGGSNELKAALSKKLGVAKETLVIGNGSNDIIELLVRTFVGPEDTVVTAWPSFVVYRLVTQAHGRDAIVAPLRKLRYDLSAMAALIDQRTKLVFIANPNNPTGTYVSKREVAAFLDRIPRSAIVVLDEAYFEYTTAADYPNGLKDFTGRPRLVVLRTFSKAYGLAGLRVGYGVMDPLLVDYVDRVRQPYNVSVVAQAAAMAALEDDAHLEKSKEMVRAGMKQLEEGFRKMGIEPVPSQANFVLVRLPHPGNELQEALKERGILVRAMAGYGMPETIRITVGTQEMNARVLAALEELLAERRSNPGV